MANLREQEILKYVSKSAKGIEVAPWHSPIAPKSAGFNIKTLDIFDGDTLRQKCAEDAEVCTKVDQIEDVDFVSSALLIDECVERSGELGTFDYIISSHNFEHLPDPIRFLRACGRVLKKGGVLSMAIPDKTRTFDYVRNVSKTSDLLRNYFEQKLEPDPYDIFDFESLFLRSVPPSKHQKVETVNFAGNLNSEYNNLIDRIENKSEYTDAHVTVYNKKSFDIIISELMHIDIIPFDILEIKETDNMEFYVHLKNIGHGNKCIRNFSEQERLRKYLDLHKDDFKFKKKSFLPRKFLKMKRKISKFIGY